jgi:hypothetical protein
MKCHYCDNEINARSDRARSVIDDPDGITAIHYQRIGARFGVSYVTTSDGDACPRCVGTAKNDKRANGPKSGGLAAEMKARKEEREKQEKEKKDA